MSSRLLLFSFLSIVFFTACNPFNSPQAKQGFAEISKMQIKQLVMHIEFYKLQHAQYPDSLPQLEQADPMVPLMDATAGLSMTDHSFYNYQRIGEKYTLFSSGADGTAGTKDDFYPEVSIPDSSKIGLIRKR